jgi:protein TonB
MRWSTLPVSVAAHVAAFVVFLIIPVIADVDLPPIARSPGQLIFMPAAAVPQMPEPVPPRHRAPEFRDAAAPIRAPDRIAPEEPIVPAGPQIEGALPPQIGMPVGPPHAEFGHAPAHRVPPPSLPPPPKIVRVGGVIKEPKKLAAAAPMYPAIARAARVQGLVVLEAVIDERGIVTGVRVVKSVPLLDEAAMQAVRQWRYTPTLLNGVPVSVLLTISIQFKLE